ncbi:MAG: FAD-dependent urate hydroxylase HpxO [Janthinobacterium lividum]
MKPLEVIVIGAGMGGLSCALALQRQGHSVRVFERTAELRPIGAAISIWPNGVKILRALGLGAAIDAAAGHMTRMSYRDRDGALLTGFSLLPLYERASEIARPIARTALQRILLDAVEAVGPVRLGAACSGFAQDADGVTVRFADGSQTRADLLVIADGSRSGLRDAVVGRPVPRVYCGYVNWNGRIAISPELGNADEWSQFVGDGQRVSLMPMGNGQFYFFFDVPLAQDRIDAALAPGATCRDELAAHFAGWAAPVQQLIARLDPATVARVAIHDTAPLDSLVNGRVALLGDAAHAMSPDLGQGGCQAIEDSWVLAGQLASGNGDVPAALAGYDAARAPRVASIVTRARERARVIHGRDPALTAAWYAELAREDGEAIIAGLYKTVSSGPLQ